MGEADDDREEFERARAGIDQVTARGSLPARARDPVLHHTLTAVMWLRHALRAALDGRHALAEHLGELASASVLDALSLADPDPPPGTQAPNRAVGVVDDDGRGWSCKTCRYLASGMEPREARSRCAAHNLKHHGGASEKV